MKHAIYPIVFLLAVAAVTAQDRVAVISGKVVDARTGEPVPFASIQLKGDGIGTACNAAGEFVFNVPGESDSVQVSSVGYTAATVHVRSGVLKRQVILLEPATLVLKEVTVNAQSALDIVKEAVARIPQNYDTSNVQMSAFYRENILLDDFQLAFNEAVLEVHKTFRYTKEMNDQIRIVKGRRKKVDFGNEAQLYFWMSGFSNGARGCLGDDLVKYAQAKYSPFNSRNFRHYTYEYGGILQSDSRNLLMVDVIPRKRSVKSFLRARVYLEEASLAFVKIDLELSPAGVARENRRAHNVVYFLMSRIVHVSMDFTKLKASVLYQQSQGKWHLASVRRHWDVEIDSKRRNWEDKRWQADMALVITGVDTANVRRLDQGNIGDNRASMGSMIGDDPDEAFWENYNIEKAMGADSLGSASFTVDSLQQETALPAKETAATFFPNRQNGFTRADTLRGKLTRLRTCYDVTFYHLDVDIDIENRSVKGSVLMRFNAVQDFRTLQVDLYANMKINSIAYRGASLVYTREFDAVFITLPEAIAAGATGEIVIDYEGIPKVPDRSIPMDGGVLWEQDDLGNPWAQVVCQGSGASLWWPNKDHLSDEPDSVKIWITVPDGYTEVSNGVLQRKTPRPGRKTRFEWFVSYPINNYNVTFSIGKYVHLHDRYVAEGDTLQLNYYVMHYNAGRVAPILKGVPSMLKCFEDNFGRYPFRRDGFALVESLHAMEHQSGVCIGRITQDNTLDINPLVWHESAHEWWGNAVSCADLADMWIHEAFATYAEALIIECRYGRGHALQFMNEHRGAIKNAEPVIGVYDVNHIHYDIGDMYGKGMLVLHTFRTMLNNDAQWFTLLRGIQQHFRYQTISTVDLVRYINAQVKADYTWFFDQYLRHTALPLLEVFLRPEGRDLVVQYRWKAGVPDFHMPVKMTVAPGIFEFVYPTTELKSMKLKGLEAGEFDVDEENGLIEVDVRD